jgi:YVTN family beta-propeller protein
VAVDPTTHAVYVTSYDGLVYVIDESGDSRSGTVTATIQEAQLGDFAFGVAADPSSQRVYVANAQGGTVGVIDESSDTVVSRLDVGALNGPWAVAFDPVTDRVYVTNSDGNSVWVIRQVSGGSVAGRVTDSRTGAGIAGACVRVVSASVGTYVNTTFYADDAGNYAGLLPAGSYKLIATDCVQQTHATTYYGGADNYDFLGPHAAVITVTATSQLTELNIALPLAGRISGTVTDAASGAPLGGICAYAIDTTANELRAYSPESHSSGKYAISGLPPGTDQVAFESCTGTLYPLTYSQPVTVIPGATVQVNEKMSKS